jgi:hypothetical protein
MVQISEVLKPLTHELWKTFYLLFCLFQIEAWLKSPHFRTCWDVLICENPETV